MTELETLVLVNDLDLLLEQVADPAGRERLTALGFEVEGEPALRRTRARLLGALERRWVALYERAFQRYGRAMTAVRDRVCMGCHITLPTSAQPTPGLPMVCESCGRLLYWPQPSD